MFTAISDVTIDLPTPPLPLTTPMTFFISLKLLVSSRKLCGWLLQLPALGQLLQSDVQPSVSAGSGAADGQPSHDVSPHEVSPHTLSLSSISFTSLDHTVTILFLDHTITIIPVKQRSGNRHHEFHAKSLLSITAVCRDIYFPGRTS